MVIYTFNNKYVQGKELLLTWLIENNSKTVQ